MFGFKALNGLSPPYLSKLLTLRDQKRALRSSDQIINPGVSRRSLETDPPSGPGPG